MLTVEQNERLTRVGPGAPMGELLRRYWQPVAAVEDLEREEVLPVRLLGEDLVLYKTTVGEMGLIQDRCPHRSMSMAYGIPDTLGIRCAYHGWLFNAEGRCLEQPYDDLANPENTFKERIRVAAYPVQALGGLVWAYMGPDPAPLLPRWDLLVRDDLKRRIGFTHLPCSWLQCMENSLDPVHFEWLHANLLNYVARRRGQEPVMFAARHRQIAFDVFEYGIYKRRLLEGDTEESDDWTTGHPILFPNTLQVNLGFQFRVPVDDTNTLHITYTTTPRRPEEAEHIEIYEMPYQHEDGRLVLETVLGTDMAGWVTQGAITPRHLEHLGLSDTGIILYRKLLSDAIDAVARGEDPPGLVRDPARNEPWIALRREGVPRAAYQLPGEDRAARLARVARDDVQKPRTVGALTPKGR